MARTETPRREFLKLAPCGALAALPLLAAEGSTAGVTPMGAIAMPDLAGVSDVDRSAMAERLRFQAARIDPRSRDLPENLIPGLYDAPGTLEGNAWKLNAMTKALDRLQLLGRIRAPHVRFDPGGPLYRFSFPSGESAVVADDGLLYDLDVPGQAVCTSIDPLDSWAPSCRS